MTTRSEMAAMASTNAETEAVLRRFGTERALRAAAALKECTSERKTARGRWPKVCGRAGCAWCSKPLLQGWPEGMARWAATQRNQTTFLIPLHYAPGEIREAVQVVRRALRDLRDRRGRTLYGRLWRRVSMTGIAGTDGLRLHVVHAGLGANEVCALIQRRWPAAQVVPVNDPVSMMFQSEDRAALALAHRGAEFLRVSIMPQGFRLMSSEKVDCAVLEPLPFLF
jgi:hypothetical protein